MGWEIVSAAVIGLLTVLDNHREKDKDRVDQALEALGDAYYSTVSYYETEINDPNIKRHRQLELAEKWDKVATLTRRYDANLASRFSLKSRFWHEGEAWDNSQIKGANIGLEKIRRDARFILISKQKG